MKIKKLGHYLFETWYWIIVAYGIACCIALVLRIIDLGFMEALK